MNTRTPEQIREHYEVEREIAYRLHNSTAEERQRFYTEAYDELFTRLPHHPQLKGETSSERQRNIEKQVALLHGFLDKETVFVEIGPGDCALSFAIAPRVKKVYAIDVSAEVTKRDNAPGNFELLLSDGSSIPLPPDSVDIVFSDQLMEHLHPDDALNQLENIQRSLKKAANIFALRPTA